MDDYNMKIGVGIAVLIIVLVGGYFLVVKTPAPEAAPAVEQEVAREAEETEVPVAATGEVREFTIEGGMMYFSPETIEVNEGDTVRIVFKNVEGRHDWVLDEFNARTSIIGAGEEETVEFVASRSGTYEYYCSVGNHRAMGMVGTLVVN